MMCGCDDTRPTGRLTVVGVVQAGGRDLRQRENPGPQWCRDVSRGEEGRCNVGEIFDGKPVRQTSGLLTRGNEAGRSGAELRQRRARTERR